MSPADSEDLMPFLPPGRLKVPAGMSFGFGRDESGAYICLHGSTNSENDVAAMMKLADGSSRVSTIPAASVSFGATCGGAGAPEVGRPLAVTYRLTN